MVGPLKTPMLPDNPDVSSRCSCSYQEAACCLFRIPVPIECPLTTERKFHVLCLCLFFFLFFRFSGVSFLVGNTDGKLAQPLKVSRCLGTYLVVPEDAQRYKG